MAKRLRRTSSGRPEDKDSEKAAVVSLGCAKNLVDSEIMVPQIIRLGYTIVSDPSQASLIVVNTCGFLQSSVEEAIETVLELALFKESGACRHLVVTGCMVQRYGKKLLSLLPEVDLFLGASHYDRLESSLLALKAGNLERLRISASRYLPTSEMDRLRSTPFFSAYLKIAEGCSNRCTYCLIPRLRGPYRSRAIEDVLKEARSMAAEGVKEINLIAQDTTAYGSDLGDPSALLTLLELLDDVEGIEWLRLLYVYPDRVNTKLLKAMARSKIIVPYLDIPLQHSVPKILDAMRRGGSSVDVVELIALIREVIPEIALRTSLMVGFPGETEEDFESLCSFVERTEFDHVGVFAFSPEPGARAAKLPMQIDAEIRERRRSDLLELQKSVSRRILQRKVGLVRPVLIEGFHPETELLLSGRLATQAPEVDGSVLITSGAANVGEIVPARITGAHDYDLEAELILPPYGPETKTL